MRPEGLRHSERQLWDACEGLEVVLCQPDTIRAVLARLARFRTLNAEAREELAALRQDVADSAFSDPSIGSKEEG